MNELKAELQKLYADASKHSVYQNVPDFVSTELGYTESIDENWRSDRPRLAWLLASRVPLEGESWLDFGANTGFFTLSLAHRFPRSAFVAVEANPNHARFIERVARYFEMGNVQVIQHAVGFRELHTLPHVEFMLHLNVLHHAGHDFDAELVPDRNRFAEYVRDYLDVLRGRTDAMLFQIGSNWGGDKNQPLVGMHEDAKKLRLFANWLRNAGWRLEAMAYPCKCEVGRIGYDDVGEPARVAESGDVAPDAYDWKLLDQFPGEFYRRPLFRCSWG